MTSKPDFYQGEDEDMLAPLASNLHNVWLTHLQVMQDLVTLPQRVRQVRETHSKSMVFL